MSKTLILAALLCGGGCTKNNVAILCVPGDQKACACPGGLLGAQACNADGTGFDPCLGCGGETDLSAVEPSDLSVPDVDLAAATDLPAGSDLPVLDLSGFDLVGTAGTACGVVTILLDRSGSMDDTPSGGGTGPSKLAIAKLGITRLATHYGGRIPFGFATFQEDLSCDSGIDILVEPVAGSASAVVSAAAAVVSGGGTNTGQAIAKISTDPKIHDPARTGSYIILITDGDPNCGANGMGEPAYTISEIAKAAGPGVLVKTFVIGLGALTSATMIGLDGMAKAGGEECSGAVCNAHSYYSSDSQGSLDSALDLIANAIVGSAAGGSCGGFGCFPTGAACVVGDGCCGQSGCKTLGTDPANCGGCGNACGAGGTCVSGHCVCTGTTCAAQDYCCGSFCCGMSDM